tara:strand:+ start:1209 stop:2675 length:1467 start_codon:yes stop_codon:yes gene_type:complete
MKDANNMKWYEKLRVNSWEIEILIVACILAALFNIPDFAEDKLQALAVSNHNDSLANNEDTDSIWMVIGLFKMFVYYGVSSFLNIAKLTFSCYILFRGFWVAVIGLSSVFPKGINRQKLNFSLHLDKTLPKQSFDRYILRLDNICSSIFSLGFLTGLYTISIMVYLSFSALFVSLVEYFININNYMQNNGDVLLMSLFFVLLIFGIIFFLDILFLGILKRIKWKVFSYPYSKLYKILRILTLFFLYESVYYLFVSNVKRRVVLFCWLLLAIFLVFFFISEKANGYLAFPKMDTINSHAFNDGVPTELRVKSFMAERYYEDRLIAAGNNFSSTSYPFINTEIISENYLKLHIPFHPYIHSSIDSACGLTNPNRTWKIKVYGSWFYDKLINCINSQYAVYIDNDTIANDFSFYNYSAIVDDKDVFIKTFFMPIPLNKYQEGKHIITIEKLFYEGYEYVNPERYGYAISSDSTVLVKAADSLIHIPFYIYR